MSSLLFENLQLLNEEAEIMNEFAVNGSVADDLKGYTDAINSKVKELYDSYVESGMSTDEASKAILNNLETCDKKFSTVNPLKSFWKNNTFEMKISDWSKDGDIQDNKDFKEAILIAQQVLDLLNKPEQLKTEASILEDEKDMEVVVENNEDIQDDIQEDVLDVTQLLTDNEIPFTENEANDKENNIGKYTLYDGLIQIYEPTSSDEVYMLYLDADPADVEDVMNALKEKGLTEEKFDILVSIVGEEFYTLDDEKINDITKLIDMKSDDLEVIDEIVIEEESVIQEDLIDAEKYLPTLTESGDNTTSDTERRLMYVEEIIETIYSLDTVPYAINAEVKKLYSICTNIEDIISKLQSENL